MRILALLALLCSTLAAQEGSSPRPEHANRQWEYASVSSQPMAGHIAVICYATAQGCRREVVEVTGNAVIVGDAALMKATYRLAGQGWELVTSDSHPDTGRTLIFRRPEVKP